MKKKNMVLILLTIIAQCIIIASFVIDGSVSTSTNASSLAPITAGYIKPSEEPYEVLNTTLLTPSTASAPGEDGEYVSVMWETVGFAAYTPLSIDQVKPGMQVCRVFVGNGVIKEDYYVHEVLNFVPMTPGAEPPSYVENDPYRVLVEGSFDSDRDGKPDAFMKLMYASDMGLTGDRQEVRTFAGTCLAPISSELLTGTL